MKKLLTFLIISPLLALAAGIGAVFFTELPAQFLETSLREGGYDVQGLHGNLNKGLGALSFKISNKDFALTLSNVEFEYGGLVELFSKHQLIIQKLRVQRAELKLISALGGAAVKPKFKAPGAPAADSNPVVLSDEGSPLAKIKQQIQGVQIVTTEIGDFKIKSAALPGAIESKNPTFKGFTWSNGTYQLAELKVESPTFNIALRGAKGNWTTGAFSHEDKIAGAFKIGFTTDIKKEIPFAIMADSSTTAVPVFNILAFDEKLQIQYSAEQGMQFRTLSLTPREYFNTVLPVTDIVLTGHATTAELKTGAFPVEGEFKLGPVAFRTGFAGQPLPNTQKGIHAYAQDGGANYLMVFKPRLSAQSFAQPGPWWELTSDKHPSPKDSLTFIYFRKPVEKVAIAERMKVEEESAALAAYTPIEQDAAPAQTAAAAPVAPVIAGAPPAAPSTAPAAEPARVPASQ